MPDFRSRLGQKAAVDNTDPIKLFESLDRRTTHTVLRPVQVEALQALAARRTERDLVLKVSTGGGKTTTALLYLQSHMAETGKPSAYLCPNRQLVSQVLREAESLGIRAFEYPAGEPHPHPDCLRGKAIVVCTYDKLFNAKTTFLRDDVGLYPYAIVLDDAHAGLSEIRQSFTLSIPSSEVVYRSILGVLQEPCKAYDPASWEFIERADRDAQMEVPFWIWAEKEAAVRDILVAISDRSPYVFRWGYLKSVLRWCRILVSGTSIEIVPDVPPVHLVPPYDRAERRLFTSATLSDDSVLVRELGCAVSAAQNPITLLSDGGIGERMVLAPSLISPKLDRAWVMQWAERLSRSYNVVVLCPSEKVAREWQSVGAATDLGEKVHELVEDLRSGTRRFVALAQRYDGVDLPDDACRVLVIDGLPKGQTLVEQYDTQDPGSPNGSLQQWCTARNREWDARCGPTLTSRLWFFAARSSQASSRDATWSRCSGPVRARRSSSSTSLQRSPRRTPAILRRRFTTWRSSAYGAMTAGNSTTTRRCAGLRRLLALPSTAPRSRWRLGRQRP